MKKQQSWGIGLLIICSLLGLLLVGCHKQAVNQQITQSKTAWYLYQKPNQNVQRLHFYRNQTVGVQHVSLLGDRHGSSVLNAKFANPTYQLNQDGQEITINTTHPKMILAVKKAYHEQQAGYTLTGFDVTYQGEKWKLGQITKVNHAKNKKYRQYQKQQQQAQLTTKQSDQLGPTLLKHLVTPSLKNASSQLNNQSIAGEYNYRALLGMSRVYGHLSIDAKGHFTNTLYVHAKQSVKNPNQDNPVMLEQQTISGTLTSLYGKLYFKPANVLSVKYFTAGQNPENPAIKSFNLTTNSKRYGQNIKLAKYRIEKTDQGLMLFNQDLKAWTDQKQTTTDGVQLYANAKVGPTLKQQYDKLYQHYQDLKKAPITSNADLRQYVAVNSSQHDNTLAGIGINLAGKFSITQDAKSFTGIDRQGKQQPIRQYVALLEPAILQDQKSKHTVNTPAGQFLVFGVYQQRLYLLQQPDSDSTTTTWTGFKNLKLKLPIANITWN